MKFRISQISWLQFENRRKVFRIAFQAWGPDYQKKTLVGKNLESGRKWTVLKLNSRDSGQWQSGLENSPTRLNCSNPNFDLLRPSSFIPLVRSLFGFRTVHFESLGPFSSTQWTLHFEPRPSILNLTLNLFIIETLIRKCSLVERQIQKLILFLRLRYVD